MEFSSIKRIAKFGLPLLLMSGAILSLAVIANASAPRAVQAQTGDTQKKSDIGVTGTGRVNVQPDLAVASVGVEITAPTLAGATEEANENMTAVIDAIKAQGVDAKDIQTSSYNVFPITSEPKEGETPKITGYRVSNIVTVKIRNIANVGKVMDAALAAGANSINGVYFTVSDPTKYQDQARTLAVKQAMATAQTLASAAGVKVGKITSITDLTGGVQPVYKGAGFEAVPASASAGPVETGQTEITATVEIHFEIVQ